MHVEETFFRMLRHRELTSPRCRCLVRDVDRPR
jgi:hypothetical protein